ncbi:hypothetical protein JFV30_05180 [Pseudomonas sp. TH32]|uniref:hypothetical protein n=1 Tax=Pseudomonas sp. TH32 TaxID=2796397 RepID=UPI001913C121|nr:hypothetical protein [Pseudomonas sp. TH32]
MVSSAISSAVSSVPNNQCNNLFFMAHSFAYSNGWLIQPFCSIVRAWPNDYHEPQKIDEYDTVASFQLREPAFHGAHPRTTGWCEVQLETRLVLESMLDGRRFVSRVVSQDDKQVERCGFSVVDLLQKRQKLFNTVALAICPMVSPATISKGAYKLKAPLRL